MMSVYQGSEMDQIVDGMTANMKFQIEIIMRDRDNYDWSRLEFPVSIKDIGKFETRNNISVNVLAVEGRDIYIHRKGRRMGREINLLMVSEDGINHYTAIKSLSRLLKSSNTKHKCKQHELLAGFYARI